MSTSNNQKIGLATATIVGMNAMIGAGIFSVPAALASCVGPAGILTYVFVIIAVWFMAQSIARVAQLYPQAGSFYTYTKPWGGHTLALMSAFSYMIGLFIAMGLLAQFAGIYLHWYFPAVSPYILGLCTLGALTALNIGGVSLSELGQNILIVCTVFPLLTVTGLCLTKAHFSNLIPFAPHGYMSVLRASRIAIFGFFGFECAASLFNVVKDPSKTVPRALTLSIIIVGTIYLFFVGSIILSTPLHCFTDPNIPITVVLKDIFPNNHLVIEFIHASMLSAVIGTIHSMLWSSSELLRSLCNMVKSGPIKAIVNNNWLTHTTSVLFVGSSIFLSYVTLKNLDLFFNLTAMFIVFAYATSMITLLTLESEWKSGRNIRTILGLLTAAAIFAFAVEGLIASV